MCLSSVYEVKDGAERLVSEHVSAISSNGGNVTLTDIMGEEVVITGEIYNIDLVKNVILVKAGA